MEREIKFRAFQDNEMLTQPLSSIYGMQRFLGMLYEDAELMQYTGMKDKNGVEIYEGDTLFKGSYFGHVKFKEREYECIAVNHNGMDILDYRQEFIEVVGNIHENK